MKRDKKILFLHLHAEGTKAEFSGARREKAIRDIVHEFNPDIVISGHIHEETDKIGNTQVGVGERF